MNENANNSILTQLRALTPRPFGVNPHWASYSRMLQQWVADGTTVRIEYSPPGATVAVVGPSPVTSKLLDVSQGNLGRLNVRVPSPKGPWNIDASDAYKGTHFLPVVTSITPVIVAQTPEEIDTIMQRAAKSGTRVSVVTADEKTHTGQVFHYHDRQDPEPYRVPAYGSGDHDYWWLGTNPREVKRRIVSVRELTAEKQTEAQMLELLQTAKRDGNHVEATMADGSKRTGPVCDVWMSTSYRPGCMVKCQIGDEGASFGAVFGHERIAAIKVLPREEKRPTIQVKLDAFASDHVVTFGTGAVSLGYTATMQKTHITPTCCADVLPYLGRRVRVTDTEGNDDSGTIALVGLYDGKQGFELEEHPDNYWSFEGLTIELLPDAPYARPCQVALTIEPKVPADLEPYIGRRVRVLAGDDRQLVREGTLASVVRDGFPVLKLEGHHLGWHYGPAGGRSTFVEVLPELQDEEPDDSEDDTDDDLEDEEIDESVPSDFLHRACDATLGDFARTIIASTVESRLTLAGLLAMAPPPNDIRAYEAFQLTVREAMATGVIRG
jgi:hypothetical protein